MRHFIAVFFLILLFTFSPIPTLADGAQEEFTNYMLEWREKSELAQSNLREAEDELKSGSKYKACIKQRLASELGVEAYHALISAQQINDSDKQFENIEEYLLKWKKLASCNTAGALFN